MEAIMIKTSQLKCNEGQVSGLPSNPRFIKDDKFELLKKSLRESPEMLHLRELLVFPYGKEYVVIGGNMRLRAAKELGIKELPCKVLAADTPIEKLCEYAIKDNNGYGQDDWDKLANEWEDMPLADWGMDMPEFEEIKQESGEQEDLSDKLETSFRIEVTLANESEQETLYNELTSRGWKCKILTL